jgi:hypothetical protein
MTLYLGSHIGFEESLYNEFKEMSLKLDAMSFYDSDEIKSIVMTGKIDENFNDLIIHNINHYFKFYLPKYISAFGNLQNDSDDEDKDKEYTAEGNLYIGINDMGEITGFPFNGEIDENIINELKDSIKVFIHTNEMYELFSKIKVDVIKLKINEDYLDDPIAEIIEESLEKYKFAKKLYLNFVREQIKWIESMDYYNVRMSQYITDPIYRKKIASFIREKTTNPQYLLIADQLETNHKFKILTGYEIGEQKSDMNNVYHWITEYKDISIDLIKLNKPKRPYMNSRIDEVYQNQLQFLTNLRLRFIKANSGINYYYLKISLPTNHKHNISYSSLKAGATLYSKVRMLVDGSPCCL